MVVYVYLDAFEMVINNNLTLLVIDFVADVKLYEKTFAIVHNTFCIWSDSVAVIPFLNLNIADTNRAGGKERAAGLR